MKLDLGITNHKTLVANYVFWLVGTDWVRPVN